MPAIATQHVTVARPALHAVERVSVGSVPSLSVVNEPTTIVTPGKPIRGHSYTSEVWDFDLIIEKLEAFPLQVRHDTIARYAAPLVTYASPTIAAKVIEAPAVSEVVESAPGPAHLTSDLLLPQAYQSVVSAPQVYATGAAQVVAVIINLHSFNFADFANKYLLWRDRHLSRDTPGKPEEPI